MELSGTTLRRLLTISMLVVSCVPAEDITQGSNVSTRSGPAGLQGYNSWKNKLQKTGRLSRRTILSLAFGSCTFPFTFNGTSYNECTNDGGVPYYWCGCSADFDKDSTWSACTYLGAINGISQCVPVSPSNRSSSICLVDIINIAVGRLGSCTQIGIDINGYMKVVCDTPSSTVKTKSSFTTPPTVTTTAGGGASSSTAGGGASSSTAGGGASSSTAGGGASSSTAGGGASSSTAGGALSSTAGGGASSSTAGGGASSSTAGGGASSSTAGGGASSSTAGGGASSSTAGGGASSSTAGGGASSSTAGGASSSTAGGGASSSTAGEGASSSTAGGGASSSTAGGGASSSTARGGASSSTAGGGASSSTAGGGASSSTTEGGASSSTAGGGASSSTAGGASSSTAGGGASSSTAGGGVSSSTAGSTAGTSLRLPLEQIYQNLSVGGSVTQALRSFLAVTSAGVRQDDLPLVLYLLGNITRDAEIRNQQIDVDTVQKLLVVVDQLTDAISSGPAPSLEENLGPQLLLCLENLLSVLDTTEQSFTLSFSNLDLHSSVSPCDALEDNGILSLDSGTTISLPSDTYFPSGCLVNLLSMNYRPQNGSFSSRYDCNRDEVCSYSLAGDIQTHVLTLNNMEYHMVDINMTFTCGNGTCDQNTLCVYWDFHLNMWSSRGCVTQVMDGVTSCLCHHLTSFSILMSGYLPKNIANSPVLDYMTIIGLAVSIVSLLICISIQVILLKQTRIRMAFHRHMAILHMSSFLLISHISFLISSLIDHNVQEKLCVALTFCTHLSLLGFFSWTLVQGIVLAQRLLFVFHHVTMMEFTVLSVVLGYAFPLTVAGGTMLAYYPLHYRVNSGCWLDVHSGASLTFTIPTIVIMSLNVLVLIVVIRALIRPTISEEKSEDEEVLKKVAKAVLFCTPQFGLTWAIGIPLLINPKAECLHYLFDLLNPLQGIFILLFGCLLDSKVTAHVKKHFLKTFSTISQEPRKDDVDVRKQTMPDDPWRDTDRGGPENTGKEASAPK
ncbi:adhesion G-protein coupled receptor F1-like isoform X2 [Dendropsophus ebraccatus]|uniref:adhesion G-protein coupled receptor F1-like isoform X2 n=1 Tax=Dendropsophus ebraccatus TaxID=150705 RepID=UPI003831560A